MKKNFVLIGCGALLLWNFAVRAAGAGETAAGCPQILQPVPCAHPLTADLELNGQIMTCRGDLSIQARLRLTNGSRLASSGRFFVTNGGALITEGKPDCPVRITSAQRSPGPGDWSTLWVQREASNDSMLTHTIVEYGGDGEGAITLLGGGSIGFDDVTVQHTKGLALNLAEGIVTRFHAVKFNHIPDAPVRIHPDYAAVVEPDIAIDTATVQKSFVDVQALGKNTMSIDGTWEALPVPYRLFGDITFTGALTIGEGARIWIAPAQRFFVADGGSIMSLGTADHPIEIRSANRTGRPKDWRQIHIQATAANDSAFQHTSISHGGADGVGALSLDTNATVTLDHVTFADNGDCDIAGGHATINATNSSFVPCE